MNIVKPCKEHIESLPVPSPFLLATQHVLTPLEQKQYEACLDDARGPSDGLGAAA